MRAMTATILTAVLAVTPLIARESEPARRLGDAALVLSQIMDAPERRIPEERLERARCLVIVPDLKVGRFVIGGQYGKGFVACRNGQRIGWSAPGALLVDGGRVGFHIGGASTDLIMLVMNGAAADRLLGSRFTLGVEGAVAAGPVGRALAALTDAQTHADALTWSRTGGLLSGVALEGVTLHQDLDDNESLYGRRLANGDIVAKNIRPPDAAGALLGVLSRYSVKARTQ